MSEERPVEFVHENTGVSRRDRRHIRISETGKRFFIPKKWQAPATNVPYRKEPNDELRPE